MDKILAVDDQQDNLDLLVEILEEKGYCVSESKSGLAAISKAKAEKPDVILLDIQMPEMNGFEVCKALKADEKTKDIPIIFLTAQTGEESVVKGLEVGAYDYITKPFIESELLARIGVMLRITKAEKKVKEMAVTDALTGLHNRRYLFQRFEEEISRAKRKKTALACIMIDIDYFKKINDAYGHDIGDFVLVEVAKLLKDNIRNYDTIVRYGGEEFFAILPGENKDDALLVAEKIRAKIENYIFRKNDLELKVTISLGICAFSDNDLNTNSEEYIKFADNALYEAKNSGRNKVILSNNTL